ncbi:hypothetical protein PPERSA_08241 [Pseudocohnilembus persalinus]|uniref:C3H1-type domain-containing protein n=1 Tax=Pseudocohnilembus persalinus TaxID=266149 RepID=A0A0V0QG11_PSEPJ|nr:hypothetical protein PPERSA_08241 [Pseudocohnilembus persalinus]|eukprot:KRX01140.1 hypothetical protein PPERSA_08241 [Pseudocohnilembus persalinus]
MKKITENNKNPKSICFNYIMGFCVKDFNCPFIHQNKNQKGVQQNKKQDIIEETQNKKRNLQQAQQNWQKIDKQVNSLQSMQINQNKIGSSEVISGSFSIKPPDQKLSAKEFFKKLKFQKNSQTQNSQQNYSSQSTQYEQQLENEKNQQDLHDDKQNENEKEKQNLKDQQYNYQTYNNINQDNIETNSLDFSQNQFVNNQSQQKNQDFISQKCNNNTEQKNEQDQCQFISAKQLINQQVIEQERYNSAEIQNKQLKNQEQNNNFEQTMYNQQKQQELSFKDHKQINQVKRQSNISEFFKNQNNEFIKSEACNHFVFYQDKMEVVLMVAGDKYKLRNLDVRYILGIIINLCQSKKVLPKLTDVQYANKFNQVQISQKFQSDEQKFKRTLLLSLYSRSKFGGMTGDIVMVNQCVNYYTQLLDNQQSDQDDQFLKLNLLNGIENEKYDELLLKQQKLQDGQQKDEIDSILVKRAFFYYSNDYNEYKISPLKVQEYSLVCIDQHIRPQMSKFIQDKFIEYQEKFPFSKEVCSYLTLSVIESLIWDKNSGVNFRKPWTLKKLSDEEEEIWKIIEPFVQEFQLKIQQTNSLDFKH